MTVSIKTFHIKVSLVSVGLFELLFATKIL